MKVSIIVVAYNVENFIEQALRSCVFDASGECEVIVIENCSTDDTLSVIKRVASEFPQIIRVLPMEFNLGLGIGRNKGLEEASGDYVLFLDGDDWFTEGAIARCFQLIDRHLADVFVFNYARSFDNGSITANKMTHILKDGDRNTPALRAEIMQNFGVVWNKIYCRRFVEKYKLRFHDGLYEDVDWNFSCLLQAATYYVIPEILIFYRQRDGSITRSQSARHKDILSQYAMVLNKVSVHPDRDVLGPAAYRYASNQIITVLRRSDRLPPHMRQDYILEADILLEKFRAVAGETRLNWRERAITWRRSLCFKFVDLTLCLSTDMKNLAARWGRRVAKVGQRVWKRLLYRIVYLRQPIDTNLVLLESFWGRRIDCNPFAIAKALEGRGYKCFWSVMDGSAPAHCPDISVVKRGSAGFYKIAARAKYLVSNTNFPDALIKRPGQVHIQTFHGTPLKFMGLDIIKTNHNAMNWNHYARRSRRWDFAISSNAYSSRIWRQNSPYGYKLIECGYPRNDILFSVDADRVASIRNAVGVPDGKKVVLYAPTFREDQLSSAATSGDFDHVAVKRALGDDYVLLVRNHYFVSWLTDEMDFIDVSAYPITNEILLISDVLITDYSSIMFDYANLGRPIILYAYDLDYYRHTRGMYLDIETHAPGAVVRDFASLLDLLHDKSFESRENMARLYRFQDGLCVFDDGNALETFVDTIFPADMPR